MGLSEDLKYPFNEDEWYKTIGIGMIYEYLTWLVFPAVFLAGYYVRVMRYTTAGRTEPPEFHDYRRLTGDGVNALAVLGLYLLVPSLVSATVFVPSLLGLLNGEIRALEGLLVGGFLSAVLFTLFGYGGVAGLVKYSRTRSIRSAFSPSLLKIIANKKWLKAWLKVAITSIISLVFSAVVAIIPLVNLVHIVLIPFQVKYFLTVYTRIFARAYAEIANTSEDLTPRDSDLPGKGRHSAETAPQGSPDASVAGETGDRDGSTASPTTGTVEGKATESARRGRSESDTPPRNNATPSASSTDQQPSGDMSWVDPDASEASTLSVVNETNSEQRVVAACRTTDAVTLRDKVALKPGEQSHYQSLPDELFQIGVILDDQRRALAKFEPESGHIVARLGPNDVDIGVSTGTEADAFRSTPSGGGQSESRSRNAREESRATAATETPQSTSTAGQHSDTTDSPSANATQTDRTDADDVSSVGSSGAKPRVSTLLLVVLGSIIPPVFAASTMAGPWPLAGQRLVSRVVYTLTSQWTPLIMLYRTLTSPFLGRSFLVSQYPALLANSAVYVCLCIDAMSVRQRTNWTPRLRYYLPGVLLCWFITIPLYLYRRQKVSSRYRSVD